MSKIEALNTGGDDEVKANAVHTLQMRNAIISAIQDYSVKHPEAATLAAVSAFAYAFDDFRKALPIMEATVLEEMLRRKLAPVQH